MFYHFRQNNSGGFFANRPGVGVNMIIEGDSVEDIVARAEQAGLYFDGRDTGLDCTCCGDRWTRPWPDEQLETRPCLYGRKVHETDEPIDPEDTWAGYIYYRDGRVVPIRM
jgi:hypothetical protein